MGKDIIDIARKVLEEHAELFQSLAEKDTLEYDVQVYILQNKEALAKILVPYQKPHSEFFPELLYDIYSAQYAENAVSILRTEIARVFALDQENALRIDRSCIKLVAEDLLHPPRG